MKKNKPTLPAFGEIVPGEGGRLGAIMRGALVDAKRFPDYALIVSDRGIGDFAPIRWGAYGQELAKCNSLTDGLANTFAMAQSNCPPAIATAALTIDGHHDWFVPSRGELWALRANVPELFEKTYYWSSTQYSRYGAWIQVFEYGYSCSYDKGLEYRVRAVRMIQLQHSNA